ncbi:MAG TPA: uroporphyrinogen-III C-methyltransferase [Gemmatimonadaceae bacterium]|nr:uroporphyrinogen-III C-methyltransferase [Gemmatimonadaceae bacterium]
MGDGGKGTGVVYLVGAGPGDPGLLTVRARELLANCDAVVFDALVNPAILTGSAIPDAAERHFVGKRGGERSARQEDIEALLVRLAREGKRVVRLKGGDPFVFGRGSEEAQALAGAGIAFEAVPGITAGVAAPAYAGIPVTHRAVATSVTFITGHEDPTKGESGTDWSALARTGGTLVLYMGVRRLPEIVSALAAGGMSLDTPAAMVEWGTFPRQRTLTATLGTLADAAHRENISAPSITVIGDVVALRDEIRWFDERPLFRTRVIVTRARAQASQLVERLAALGAEVIEAPAIRIEPLDPAPLRAALGTVGDYEWVIFTSRNAVDITWNELRALGFDARALAGTKLVAVGPATAAALAEHGIVADLIPERFVAEGIVEAMRGRGDVRDARLLYPRAEGARDVITEELRKLGSLVDDIPIYRSVPDPAGAHAAREALESGSVDVITFTSSSTVRYFVESVGADAARHAAVVSMGPVTTETARTSGLNVAAEAREATIDALVEAVLEVVR